MTVLPLAALPRRSVSRRDREGGSRNPSSSFGLRRAGRTDRAGLGSPPRCIAAGTPYEARQPARALPAVPTSRTRQKKKATRVFGPAWPCFCGFAPGISRHPARPSCLARIYTMKGELQAKCFPRATIVTHIDQESGFIRGCRWILKQPPVSVMLPGFLHGRIHEGSKRWVILSPMLVYVFELFMLG